MSTTPLVGSFDPQKITLPDYKDYNLGSVKFKEGQPVEESYLLGIGGNNSKAVEVAKEALVHITGLATKIKELENKLTSARNVLAEEKPVDPKAVDPKAVDPKAVDPKAVDPKAVDPKAVDPKAVDPKAEENPEAKEADEGFVWTAIMFVPRRVMDVINLVTSLVKNILYYLSFGNLFAEKATAATSSTTQVEDKKEEKPEVKKVEVKV